MNEGPFDTPRDRHRSGDRPGGQGQAPLAGGDAELEESQGDSGSYRPGRSSALGDSPSSGSGFLRQAPKARPGARPAYTEAGGLAGSIDIPGSSITSGRPTEGAVASRTEASGVHWGTLLVLILLVLLPTLYSVAAWLDSRRTQPLTIPEPTKAIAAVLAPTTLPTPSASPSSVAMGPAGTVVLADDFSDPNTKVFTSDHGSYVDGMYSLLGAGSAASAGIPEVMDNAGIEVDARLVQEQRGQLILACRLSNSGVYQLRVYPYYQRWLLEETSFASGGSTSRLLAASKGRDEILPGPTTNRLGLYCVGTTISAWANGLLLASVEDDARTSGMFAIAVAPHEGQTTNLEARFDNLVVKEVKR